MSALTDLFTAMANKIRSKTGTATTYTPSEMASDGIDDVYDAGVASATTPITPSNASPVSMSANTGYKPTANGYAIASYSSMGSSSRPNWLESGDILQSTGDVLALGEDEYGGNIVPLNSNPQPLVDGKICEVFGNGYAIESYSSVTPSNSSPVNLLSGYIYKMNGNGKAIASYSSITPSDSSPVTLSSGSIYKMSGAGKAVASVTSKTPSDSSPASVTANSIIQPSAAGYLVSSIRDFGAPTYVKQGNMSASGGSLSQTTSSRAKLVIAYRARYGNNNGNSILFVWDAVKEVGYSAQYADSYTNSAMPSTQTHISVTNSSVTFTNSSSYTQRGSMMIWC